LWWFLYVQQADAYDFTVEDDDFFQDDDYGLSSKPPPPYPGAGDQPRARSPAGNGNFIIYQIIYLCDSIA
jgi:hypothetical protein